METDMMSWTVMNLSRINNLVGDLGYMEEDHVYTPGAKSLGLLEKLEDELLNEDVLKRNIRLGLHLCGTVKTDLIPILIHAKDVKLVAIATRLLVNLTLPIEYLLPLNEDLLVSNDWDIPKKLTISSLAIKKAFLDAQATLALVTILRDKIINCEKHHLPLKEEECNHLKNCLILLRNILHIPEFGIPNLHSKEEFAEWQSTQSKLIWNLFVQGIDGALLLMLNSKYKANWTVPLSLIIALLYRNQNMCKVHQTLEQISSASESSGEDEESDGSKNSSTSLSSEPSKSVDMLSDSGCPLPSDTSFSLKSKKSNLKQMKCETTKSDCVPSDIHTKLERVQISDTKIYPHSKHNYRSKSDRENQVKVISVYEENNSESSSSCESPYHKKIKGSCSPNEISMNDDILCCISESDSAVSMNLKSPNLTNKSSDDDVLEEAVLVKNLKAIQKLKCIQMNLKFSESDSSNEDIQDKKVKYRSHPPTGRRGKSPRRNSGCVPSVCMDSAYEASCIKGRLRYPLWEKRNSVSNLVDINSHTPSDDDIGNVLKEFTLSFIHGGFSQLVMDTKNILLEGPSFAIDKSIFFWLVSYFLPLASASSICIDHISGILSVEVIGYLVFECVNACENMELHSEHDVKIMHYVSVHLNLLVTALKEVVCAIDLYSRKCNSPKDRAFFNELCGKLAGMVDLRKVPLLLFRSSPKIKDEKFLENVIILNHQILILIGRVSEYCYPSNKINLETHLKLFTARNTVDCYGKVLESFKSNSNFLNECVFTMMHHLAGDTNSSELLFVPSVLRSFSNILKEDIELEQYQEDLVMYILNKFSLKVYQRNLKGGTGNPAHSNASCEPSSNSSVSSNCLLSEEDDLFWWYLQFEQDKDPISRISEHIPASKKDILCKLKLKGHISTEEYKQLEEKMEAAQDKNGELLSKDNASHPNFDEEITHILRTFVQAGQRQHLIWLQNMLLETCYVKLGLGTHLAEPIPFYSIKMMLSVPLVPYNEEQWEILHDEMFLLLLQKLGLHLGSTLCQMYPRIPLFWTPDMLYNIAARLGPVKIDTLKFSQAEVFSSYSNSYSELIKNSSCPALPPLSSCWTLSSWLIAVKQSNEIYRAKQGNNSF